MEDRTTVSRLFGASGIFYAGLIDEILPHLTTHEYLFLTDEFFREWQSTSDYNVARENQIVASELIDKAHLAAATALIRTRQWIKATCSAYDCQNLVAWASAARGLIESSGDTLDGLINIAGSIANAHQVISSAIRGYQSTRGSTIMYSQRGCVDRDPRCARRRITLNMCEHSNRVFPRLLSSITESAA